MNEAFFGVVKKSHFWHEQKMLLFALPVIVCFWLFQAIGVLSGKPPLIAWMVCAGLAVVLLSAMTFDALRVSQGNNRQNLAALFLQLICIVCGNTVVLALQVIKGVPWTVLDSLITFLACSGAAIVVVIFRCRRQSLASPWAKSGFMVSLKCLPQIFQAWPLLFLNGGLHWLVVLLLVVQGWLRFSPMMNVYRQSRSVLSTPERALLMSSAVDLATVLLVAACYLIGVSGWLR